MRRLMSLAAAALLTGCTTSSESEPSPSSPAFVTPAAQAAQCRQLLELNFSLGIVTDVSQEGECRHLTSAQYAAVVKEMVAAHADEIITRAADEALYDATWDSLDAWDQEVVCALMHSQGPRTTGAQLTEIMDNPRADAFAMAEYLYKDKCW